MDLRQYKSYWPFAITIFLFTAIVFYYLSLYLTWNGEPAGDVNVEVNLPVIEWNKYTGLSKQYDSDNIDKD